MHKELKKFLLLFFIFTPLLITAENTWELRYKNHEVEDIPWFYADLDPDIQQMLLTNRFYRGRLLEVGSGPGTQAIELAKLGFAVTATDISQTAIVKATKRAQRERTSVNFVRGDVTIDRLPHGYDYVLDRACLHCLTPKEWDAYLNNVTQALRPGGTFILKCFGGTDPASWTSHSHYFTEEEIYKIFSKDFKIESIHETVYYSSYDPLPPALFIIMRKKS